MLPLLVANFGGPRNLDEIGPFLKELLCDRDLIRTNLPTWLHNFLFGRIAKKRAKSIRHDYEQIGGKSPIYFDTEVLKGHLANKMGRQVFSFHRYLPATHEKIPDEMLVLPLFPQFCYATTGSIARFLAPKKLHWIKSYAAHPAFIGAYQRRIRDFLQEKQLEESDTYFLFSAHGVPKQFVDEGDPYKGECEASFKLIMQGFPKALGQLCYQSKFGKGEWLRPYTNELSDSVLTWHQGRKNIVFIPISFTSDHIETLFEIESLYLPLIRNHSLNAFRCPALNLEPYWIESLIEIVKTSPLSPNVSLIRIT